MTLVQIQTLLLFAILVALTKLSGSPGPRPESDRARAKREKAWAQTDIGKWCAEQERAHKLKAAEEDRKFELAMQERDRILAELAPGIARARERALAEQPSDRELSEMGAARDRVLSEQAAALRRIL